MNKAISLFSVALAFGSFSGGVQAEAKPATSVSMSPAEEQDSLELLRASIRMDKREILKSALNLSEKDYEKFWPIYYEYQAQLIRIYDRKLSMIEHYADQYATITDTEVDQLVKGSFAATKAQTTLLEKYYGQVAKRLSKTIGARFVQVENSLNGAFDLKLRSKLPLVPKAPSGTAPKP
jgi:hypothetical protein